jgi:hypothetical protein
VKSDQVIIFRSCTISIAELKILMYFFFLGRSDRLCSNDHVERHGVVRLRELGGFRLRMFVGRQRLGLCPLQLRSGASGWSRHLEVRQLRPAQHPLHAILPSLLGSKSKTLKLNSLILSSVLI